VRESVETGAQEILGVGQIVDVRNSAQAVFVRFVDDRPIECGSKSGTVPPRSSTQNLT
jgi:hypothetical protein